jgi:hypothetical protein
MASFQVLRLAAVKFKCDAVDILLQGSFEDAKA